MSFDKEDWFNELVKIFAKADGNSNPTGLRAAETFNLLVRERMQAREKALDKARQDLGASDTDRVLTRAHEYYRFLVGKT